MHAPRKRVSIVIPAHNEEHHLRACLDAIAIQSERPFEVIVVDNNSTDQTAHIADEYPFVRLVREAKQGRVHARSTGFDKARGDILGRIDADIILPQNWVEHIADFYADPMHQDTAWTGAGYFYNVRLPRLVSFGYALMAFRFTSLLIGHYTLWGSNMAITRRQWQRISKEVCYRLDVHEDLDLSLHIAQAGYTITYDASVVTNAELRRVHANRGELWHYLQWLPRTMRVHGIKSWWIAWFFEAFALYIAVYLLVAFDLVARLIKPRRA